MSARKKRVRGPGLPAVRGVRVQPIERDKHVPVNLWNDWNTFVDMLDCSDDDRNRVLTIMTITYLQGMMRGGEMATDRALRIISGKDQTGN